MAAKIGHGMQRCGGGAEVSVGAHGAHGGTHGNADSVDAKISETENARPVRDDADLGLGVRPIAQHGANRLPLLNRNVQRLGLRVQRGILQTDIADGGGVNKRHELTDIVDQEAIEEIDVLVLQRRQIQVLVDVGLTCIDHLHRPRALRLEALHGVWY